MRWEVYMWSKGKRPSRHGGRILCSMAWRKVFTSTVGFLPRRNIQPSGRTVDFYVLSLWALIAFVLRDSAVPPTSASALPNSLSESAFMNAEILASFVRVIDQSSFLVSFLSELLSLSRSPS